jgi:hypothetical protein
LRCLAVGLEGESFLFANTQLELLHCYSIMKSDLLLCFLTLCQSCSAFVLAPATARHSVIVRSASPTAAEVGQADAIDTGVQAPAIATPVAIRLYDIGNGMQPLISTLLRKPMPHIWHVGVSAFGSEYWFSTCIEVHASITSAEQHCLLQEYCNWILSLPASQHIC